MPKITLKNIGTVPLAGKKPGDVWSVDCDAEGTVLDPYWRKRLREEEIYKVGAIEVVKSESSPAPEQDQSNASPVVSSRKKG